MKRRYIAILLFFQMIYAYFAWPNKFVFSTTWFSIISLILAVIPYLFFTLYFQGKKAFFWCGLSGLVIFFAPAIHIFGMSYFPVISWLIAALGALIFMVIFGITGYIGSRINQQYRWAFLLVLPALMTTHEYVKIVLSEHLWFSPLPSYVFGSPMAGFLPLAQMASITGIYGPGFLGFFSAAVIALMAYEKILKSNKARAWLAIAETIQPLNKSNSRKAVLIGAIITAFMGGLIVWGNSDASKFSVLQEQSKKSISPAFLQTNYDVSAVRNWNRSEEYRVTKIIYEMAKEALKKGGEILVFTENAVPGYLPGSLDLWQDLKSIFRDVKLPAFIGVITDGEKKRHYNVWYHVDDQGKANDFYLKRYMIPFGEYMPMRPLLTVISNLSRQINRRKIELNALTVQGTSVYDLTPGQQEKLFTIKDMKIGLKVCAEIYYSQYFRESVKKGAELFISPASSNWFRDPADNYQHILTLRLRAIETRRWISYNSSMGSSAVIDALGKVRYESEFNKKSILVAKIPAISEISFYMHYGDLFALLCGLITLLFVGLVVFRRKKA